MSLRRHLTCFRFLKARPALLGAIPKDESTPLVIFALTWGPAQRAEYLDGACAGDAQLRFSEPGVCGQRTMLGTTQPGAHLIRQVDQLRCLLAGEGLARLGQHF